MVSAKATSTGPAAAAVRAISTTRVRINLAVERAAEGRRYGDLRAAAARARQAHHVAAHRERGVRARTLVARRESIGRGAHRAELIHARVDGAHGAALVQHQTDVNDPIAALQTGCHRLRIGHLRNELGIDEAGRLDAPGPGGERQADEFQLLRCGEQHRFVLQAVARTDFHDLYI